MMLKEAKQRKQTIDFSIVIDRSLVDVGKRNRKATGIYEKNISHLIHNYLVPMSEILRCPATAKTRSASINKEK